MCKEVLVCSYLTFQGKITLNHAMILLSMLPDITLILKSVLFLAKRVILAFAK